MAHEIDYTRYARGASIDKCPECGRLGRFEEPEQKLGQWTYRMVERVALDECIHVLRFSELATDEYSVRDLYRIAWHYVRLRLYVEKIRSDWAYDEYLEQSSRGRSYSASYDEEYDYYDEGAYDPPPIDGEEARAVREGDEEVARLEELVPAALLMLALKECLEYRELRRAKQMRSNLFLRHFTNWGMSFQEENGYRHELRAYVPINPRDRYRSQLRWRPEFLDPDSDPYQGEVRRDQRNRLIQAVRQDLEKLRRDNALKRHPFAPGIGGKTPRGLEPALSPRRSGSGHYKVQAPTPEQE
jgi:hypothetical protein